MEAYEHSQMRCADCRHYFCNACWSGYVNSAIEDGLGCLDLR